MKKFLALSLLLISVLLISACGSGGTSGENGDSDSGKGMETYVLNERVSIDYPGDLFLYNEEWDKLSGTGNNALEISVDYFTRTIDEYKTQFTDKSYVDSIDYAFEEINIGDFKALKCVYSDSDSSYMEVVIDTAKVFVDTDWWTTVRIFVTGDKLEDVTGDTVMGVVNSFKVLIKE